METNENIIDLGSIDVPETWEDVTLKMYEEIEKYYDGTDSSFDIRDVVHILCGKDKDMINSLPFEAFEDILSKLTFLNKRPEEKQPTNEISIDGCTYKVNTMEKLKTGEYVSVDTVMKADKHNYAAILAILCRKEGEIYDSKFEAEVLEDRIKMFERQPITEVLPIVSFFLTSYVASTIPSLLYTKVEEALDLTAKNIESSDKIGISRRYYMTWQIHRLRKSLKSIKSTLQTPSHSSPTSSRKGKWKRRRMLGRKQEGRQ